MPIPTAHRVADADAAPIRADRWTSDEWGLSLVPPSAWLRAPATSLNPITMPADPVFEVARFQLRLGDQTLYAQPIALTAGLLEDAGAVLSIGVAREGSGLVGADPERWEETSRIPGFVATDEELDYEGLHTFTRYFYARGSDRVAVVRLVADEDEWPTISAALFASLKTFRAEPNKPSGPIAPTPPPPPAPVATQAVAVIDESLAIRSQMLARAASMLAIPYVWGGNSPKNGMDCSAWLSRVWGVERYSTDSIWQVSFEIAKEELRPGDALDLTTGRDPRRHGHIRLFEAWANAAHTAMWVYEETPPRSVHRVVAYDDRYQPIRLFGLSAAGVALIVPGTPAPERTSTPRTPRPTARPTLRPLGSPRVSATPKTSPRPSSPVPSAPREIPDPR